ncbi:hypothetical protein D9M72_255820 [compost metagenome]
MVDEQGGFHRIQGQPFHPGRQLVRGAHDFRQRGQCLAGPVGNRGPVAQRLTDHQDEAVDQAAQRCRGVCIGGPDGRLDGVPRHCAVKGRVTGAPEQHPGGVQDGQLPGVGGVKGAQVLAVARLTVPRLSERVCLPLEMKERPFVGGGHGTQDPDLAFEHKVSRSHAGHEGDLRIPVLHGKGRSRHDAVAAVGQLFDFLFRHVEAGAAAEPLKFHALDPHLPQEQEDGGGTAGIQLGLDSLIGELRPAPDPGPAHQHRHHLGRRIQVELPHEGGAQLAGKQAAGLLADDLRVQRNPTVRGVERLPPAARLGVERTARCHKGRHVGDGIENLVPVA